VQFSRSIGGTLGVSVMGIVLSMQLMSRLRSAGIDPNSVSVDSLLSSTGEATGTSMIAEGALRTALAGAIGNIFLIAFVAAAIGLIATALAPQGRISQLASQRHEHAA
jgi:hypothetical protein